MNKKDFIIFKNPHLRYRKEDFGGIVKLKLKTFIINKNQYKLINNLEKFLIYNSLSNSDKKIVDKLVENNIFLRIDINKSKELGLKL